MSEVRNYIWVIPFIGSILTAISIFTPAFISPGLTTQLLYMSSFYIEIGGGFPVPGFLGIPSLMIIGIGCTILIVICTIILFISPLTHRGKETPGSWIALGILLIGGTFFYFGGTTYGYLIYSTIHGFPASFIDGRIPSFGVIGPVIGGGLSILGFIIGRIAGIEEEVKIKPLVREDTPVIKEKPKVSQEIAPPVSESITQPYDINFCPVCGEKIPNVEARFCPGCGYNLKAT